MATLLKGHTHLQGEFSLFFDELRPPPACPGQFEEAVWPEDGGNMTEGADGVCLGSGGFEEVTLPDLEEEEEPPKIPQITGKSRKRKELGSHRNHKVSRQTKLYGGHTVIFVTFIYYPEPHTCLHVFIHSLIYKMR